ncbi:MAG: hypothetical protein OEY22_11360 [Candidatus Bathyarchaeota archaeon]|nr:hypothetical protein [Candidatus Bathyarchaeota archaeon]MDH5787939.1 hypothetical protein [Candidatus Bathyarchaeota archaeon]
MHRLTPIIALLISTVTFAFFTYSAFAHSPLIPGSNESLETAMVIYDPGKSWAIYSELHEGEESQYYSFNIGQGERIYITLLKSTASGDRNFLPSLVLMGPNVTNQGVVPSYVEIPENSGSFLVNGTQPSEATYEPFSPSSFYSLAEIDMNAPSSGNYYIAVFEPSHGGHYGLAVGYIEEYTLEEWILIPYSLISVYQWQGQSPFVIYAPMAITIAVGLGFIVWRRSRLKVPQTLFAWIGALAALSFLGTSVTTVFQMFIALTYAPFVPEVGITVLLALIPLLLGLAAIRLSLRSGEKVVVRKRIYLGAIGVIALFMWAGLFFGPALAIIGSLIPSSFTSRSLEV